MQRNWMLFVCRLFISSTIPGRLNPLVTQHDDEPLLFCVHTLPVVTFTFMATRQKYYARHSVAWGLRLRSMLAFAAVPPRPPSWDKLLKSTNLMHPVASPSLTYTFPVGLAGHAVRYAATEDHGMQLENKPVVFFEGGWLKWISEWCSEQLWGCSGSL